MKWYAALTIFASVVVTVATVFNWQSLKQARLEHERSSRGGGRELHPSGLAAEDLESRLLALDTLARSTEARLTSIETRLRLLEAEVRAGPRTVVGDQEIGLVEGGGEPKRLAHDGPRCFDSSFMPAGMYNYEDLLQEFPDNENLRRDLLFVYASSGRPVILQFRGPEGRPVEQTGDLALWGSCMLDYKTGYVETLLDHIDGGLGRGEILRLREGESAPEGHRAIVARDGSRASVPRNELNRIRSTWKEVNSGVLDALMADGRKLGVADAAFSVAIYAD